MYDEEGGENDGELDFMDVMRRMLMRGRDEPGGSASSIFSRVRE